MTLEDSATYQLIHQRGEAHGAIAEAQRILLTIGRKRFGPVAGATETAILGITDRDRLERMAEHVLDATGWDDLLATP